MILAKIKNKDIESTFQFNSETELNEKLQTNLWGKTAGLYPLSQLTPDELAQEISRVTQDELGNDLLEPMVEIPAQYTVEITDITQELAELARKEKSKIALQLSREIMAEIRDINVQKNMTLEQFESMMSDTILESIERRIWQGSFLTAKGMILSYQGTHFTSEEKSKIVALIDDAIFKTT